MTLQAAVWTVLGQPAVSQWSVGGQSAGRGQ